MKYLTLSARGKTQCTTRAGGLETMSDHDLRPAQQAARARSKIDYSIIPIGGTEKRAL